MKIRNATQGRARTFLARIFGQSVNPENIVAHNFLAMSSALPFGFRILAVFAVFFTLHQTSAFSASIPDRPEKLTFPPLNYEPPAPEKFRVSLRAGPIAYVVPDRELPLVNIVVYVRTGKYLEPAGKEGLADLTGYLLARGGIKSKSADELEERLAFLAANLNSGVGDTQGSVSLNLLSKDTEEGLGILREVLI